MSFEMNSSVQGTQHCPLVNCTDDQMARSPEFKMTMPLHVTAEHHLLFRFYHVSVDAAGSLTMRDKPLGKKPMESSTGYAWLPLLGPNGK
ncbi:unnamed protein product [Echinostoma caproni]|uniref:C2 DOCK-type domain-containing protein n=1 Tax=Echinostoma caproni TaxID=27848 RepID=A0A183ATJ6_9TREM|nr:unnamed protein product [Echinostoma caproni]